MRDRCSLATVQIIYVPEECAGDVLISYSCRKTSLEYPDVSSILIVVNYLMEDFLMFNLLQFTIFSTRVFFTRIGNTMQKENT